MDEDGSEASGWEVGGVRIEERRRKKDPSERKKKKRRKDDREAETKSPPSTATATSLYIRSAAAEKLLSPSRPLAMAVILVATPLHCRRAIDAGLGAVGATADG